MGLGATVVQRQHVGVRKRSIGIRTRHEIANRVHGRQAEGSRDCPYGNRHLPLKQTNAHPSHEG